MALYKELLKDAIFHLYNSLREYKQEIELTLITFNNDIKILKPTQNIKEMQLFEQELNFCYEGASFIGSALQEMTCLVEERTVEYKNHVPRIRYSTIVFLLSDGNINCYNADIVRKENEALQLTQQYICENHIEVHLTMIFLSMNNYVKLNDRKNEDEVYILNALELHL
jgi:uncharacterized protein YegL